MSNHQQLHGMTSVYAKLNLKSRTIKCNQLLELDKTKRQQAIYDKFEKKLNLPNYLSEATVNTVNTNDWLITNINTYTNYLPKGTIFRHIKFIPISTPDFRKVLIFNCNTAEKPNDTLKSVAVNDVSIKKPEIKRNIFTPVTGIPILLLNENKTITLPSREILVNGLINYLTEKATTVGGNDANYTINNLKLDIGTNIRNYKNINVSDRNELLSVIDDVFNNTDVINSTSVVLSKKKAEDTFNYLFSTLIYKKN